MTLAATLLTSGSDSTDANSYTTAAISPAANSLLLCWAYSAGATTAPENVFSGLGLTFAERAQATTSAGARKLTLVTAQCGPSPGSGALTITATGCIAEAWSIVQVTGHASTTPRQTAGNSGTSGTAGSATLGAGGGVDNRAFAAFAHRAQTLSSPRTNWTELSDDLISLPVGGLMTEWRSVSFESDASATWTTSSQWVGLAVEISAAAASTVARKLIIRRP